MQHSFLPLRLSLVGWPGQIAGGSKPQAKTFAISNKYGYVGSSLILTLDFGLVPLDEFHSK
jgi:hypothetical protein